jgi:hypothetical protein
MKKAEVRFESRSTRTQDSVRWARSFDGWLVSRIRTFARERRQEESSRSRKPAARFEKGAVRR